MQGRVKRIMPDFSLPEAVRMEAPQRGVQKAACPRCTAHAAGSSQPLNFKKKP
jgi:hypothetical protein